MVAVPNSYDSIPEWEHKVRYSNYNFRLSTTYCTVYYRQSCYESWQQKWLLITLRKIPFAVHPSWFFQILSKFNNDQVTLNVIYQNTALINKHSIIKSLIRFTFQSFSSFSSKTKNQSQHFFVFNKIFNQFEPVDNLWNGRGNDEVKLRLARVMGLPRENRNQRFCPGSRGVIDRGVKEKYNAHSSLCPGGGTW